MTYYLTPAIDRLIEGLQIYKSRFKGRIKITPKEDELGHMLGELGAGDCLLIGNDEISRNLTEQDEEKLTELGFIKVEGHPEVRVFDLSES